MLDMLSMWGWLVAHTLGSHSGARHLFRRPPMVMLMLRQGGLVAARLVLSPSVAVVMMGLWTHGASSGTSSHSTQPQCAASRRGIIPL